MLDVLRRLKLDPRSFHDIKPNQSYQEYIPVPENADGYVPKNYDVSNPSFFLPEETQYDEPYNPQIEQLSSIIIQRHPFHSLSLSEQNSEPLLVDDVEDNGSYNHVIDRIAIEYAMDQLRCNPDVESIDDLLDEMSDPTDEPNLEILLDEATPDEMPEMSDIEEMQEPEQPMDLEMIINNLFFPGG
jgi:hypothetical protein